MSTNLNNIISSIFIFPRVTLPSYTSPADISHHTALYSMHMRRCFQQHTVSSHLREWMLSPCVMLGTLEARIVFLMTLSHLALLSRKRFSMNTKRTWACTPLTCQGRSSAIDGLSGMPGARDSVPGLGVSYSVGTGWGPENLISLTKYRTLCCTCWGWAGPSQVGRG